MPSSVPGVYVLQAFDAERGLYPVFYVGKSTNLRARLTQHLTTASTSPDVVVVRRNVRSYFSAAPVLGAAERTAVEAALIRLLRPVCNRQVPRTSPLCPNVPPLTLWF